MNLYSTKLLLSCLLCIFTVLPVWAGSQQNNESLLSVDDLIVLTKKVENTMAAKGARVFIIGRKGRSVEDLPPDVKYSHVSFGVYSKIKTDDARIIPGYAFYNLYQDKDNPSKSKLVIDYTIDFLSGAYEPQVGIIIPKLEIQRRLLSFIGTSSYESLHNPEYSAIANPYNSKYQNCTEYVLDVINASIYKTTNVEKLKLNAKEYFDAQEINIDSFKLLFGSIFMPDIKITDHGDKIQTATFTTIANYLQRYNLAQELMTIWL